MTGDAYDNALAESSFATLGTRTDRAAQLEKQDRGEDRLVHLDRGWYNPRRRHSALGYLSALPLRRNTHE